MSICCFLLEKFKYSVMLGYGTYKAKYHVNLSCHFAFTITLTYDIY